MAIAISYSMDVLHGEKGGLKLPYRRYIWKVGTGATAFCFAYGEQQWVSGAKTWAQAKDDATDNESLRAACPVGG